MERITPAPSPRYDSAFAHSHYEFRTNPYGRKGSARSKEREATYAYENEDQSSTGVRTGMRVRHAQFGVGIGDRRRGAQRRLEDHRALRVGGREEAAGEVREARTRLRSVQRQPLPEAHRSQPSDVAYAVCESAPPYDRSSALR